MGDAQVGGGPCVGAMSGLVLGATGWDGSDRSGEWGQGGG